MTCTRCGAEVGTFDTSCGSCGAEITTAAVTTLPAPPETQTEPTPVATIEHAPVATIEHAPVATRRPRRGTVVLAVLAALALIAAIGFGVSRQQVSGRLATATIERDAARTQLQAATSHATELQGQVDRLQQVQGELDRLRATQQDERKSLDACQAMLRAASRYSSFGAVPPKVATQLAANLVSCFEGKVPSGLFG